MNFILGLNTNILCSVLSASVSNAVSILRRDMNACLTDKDAPHNAIRLVEEENMATESYRIIVADPSLMLITAGDDLGFIYGLLKISETFLKISPFWFWMDQELKKQPFISISTDTSICSPVPRVHFRGWFLNDEVLFIHWNNGAPKNFPWSMAFEALLRCGGNMVIPGTDKSSRQYADLAFQYGLWITHHHAEPLGAEIFARAYPDRAPSWAENPQCFIRLWEEAAKRQKDMKVIWTLGFRGQGDCPFWESQGEECFDTPQKRGRLISELIERQRKIVCRYVKNPIFCTNLYGEIMELYNQGFITLHPDIIKVWADNGYGHMCTRRQGNHDARVCSLPQTQDAGPHGVYYHISFHDLQAASHMTTLPNTVDFVSRELNTAWDRGIRDYWIINSSNIRPHVYYLDAVRKLWYGEYVSDSGHANDFSHIYYLGKMQVADCLEHYASALLQYGPYEDQHAGEQFYNYCVRLLARQFIRNRAETAQELLWLTGPLSLHKQTEHILDIHKKGSSAITAYYERCQKTSVTLTGANRQLFDATVLLQAKIHYFCCQGAIYFCKGILKFWKEDYQKSFYLLGKGADLFTAADEAMHQAEYGVWKGFYENDCLTDIRFTSYIIWSVMHLIRVIGDDARLADWYEDFVRPQADRKVRLLAITQHHMTDEALYEAMKNSKNFDQTED